MATPVLTVEEIQEYIRDKAENNLLLDGTEFSTTVLSIAIDLAISEFNLMPPLGSATLYTFPSKALLLSGALYKAFLGQSALLARNTMEYTDGGISIPVEERYQLYTSLAGLFQEEFRTGARGLKIYQNIEDGWGGVGSDYGTMPTW